MNSSNIFLNDNIELNLTEKEEEVYARFLEFENTGGIRDFKVLSSLEENLSNIGSRLRRYKRRA